MKINTIICINIIAIVIIILLIYILACSNRDNIDSSKYNTF